MSECSFKKILSNNENKHFKNIRRGKSISVIFITVRTAFGEHFKSHTVQKSVKNHFYQKYIFSTCTMPFVQHLG